MIVSKKCSETSINPTFTSRSREIKQTGDICRRVMRDFPLVYSETRLNKFNSADKTKSVSRVHDYCADLVDNMRSYYATEDACDSYLKEIMSVKKTQGRELSGNSRYHKYSIKNQRLSRF